MSREELVELGEKLEERKRVLLESGLRAGNGRLGRSPLRRDNSRRFD